MLPLKTLPSRRSAENQSCITDEGYYRELLLRNCQSVFSTMLGTTIEEIPLAGRDRTSDGSERVAAIIGFGGEYTGHCVISCSKSMACKLASDMLMEKFDEVDPSVMDALGEISNMVFGNVKTDLEETLGPLQLSLPTVIVGREFNVRSLANPSWIIIPLLVGGEELDVRMCTSLRLRPSNAA